MCWRIMALTTSANGFTKALGLQCASMVIEVCPGNIASSREGAF
jgi:hypothetical protein